MAKIKSKRVRKRKYCRECGALAVYHVDPGGTPVGHGWCRRCFEAAACRAWRCEREFNPIADGQSTRRGE